MKLGKVMLSGTSVSLLVIQLTIVSLIAAKYLYQRWTCPKVWTRTVAYDPEMLMRGRYLSLLLIVDGCQSTLPSAAEATMPRSVDGLPVGQKYSVNSQSPVDFPATLKVQGNRLVAIRIPDADSQAGGQMVSASPGLSCEYFKLDAPVDFYLPEHAADPTRLQAGQQLWIEVTVPPKGPPRPIQLALQDGSTWKPLAFQ
jgi:hypothetical protein